MPAGRSLPEDAVEPTPPKYLSTLVEQQEGEHILKMDSTGKGRIRVYNCNAANGVR